MHQIGIEIKRNYEYNDFWIIKDVFNEVEVYARMFMSVTGVKWRVGYTAFFICFYFDMSLYTLLSFSKFQNIWINVLYIYTLWNFRTYDYIYNVYIYIYIIWYTMASVI